MVLSCINIICVLNSDIALIKIPYKVELTEIIRPIPFECSSTGGMNVIAIGNANSSTIVQYTELKTISNLSCSESFPYLNIRESMICARGEKERNACIGGSGGPLIMYPYRSLIGLSSFGSVKECQAGAPTLFTRISEYQKWIKEVTGLDCGK